MAEQAGDLSRWNTKQLSLNWCLYWRHSNVRHYGIMCLLGGQTQKQQFNLGLKQSLMGLYFCLRFNVILVCRTMKIVVLLF